MPNLTPRHLSSLASTRIPDGFTKREGQQLAKLQNAEVAKGIVAATRVQAAGYVTATALHMTAMLSREAQFQAGGDERTAARLEHIVDNFAMYAATEVSRFQF